MLDMSYCLDSSGTVYSQSDREGADAKVGPTQPSREYRQSEPRERVQGSAIKDATRLREAIQCEWVA